MKTRKVCVFGAALAVVFCAAATVQATEYFIAPGGNGVTADGSLLNPWASPSRGADIKAEDTAAFATVTEVADPDINPPPPASHLDITVGPRTQLSTLQDQYDNRLAVSRTGVVAAFYPKPGSRLCYSRT